MIKNSVTLMGRVGSYIDTQYYDSGTVVTTVNLGVKRGENKYNNFFIKFFDTEMCRISDFIKCFVKEGDYIQVEGKLQVNEYEVEGSDKKKSSISVIGYGIKKVYYNAQIEEWCYSNDTHSSVNSYEKQIEEIPFG